MDVVKVKHSVFLHVGARKGIQPVEVSTKTPCWEYRRSDCLIQVYLQKFAVKMVFDCACVHVCVFIL